MPKTRPLIQDTSKYRDLSVLLNGNMVAENKSPEEIGRVLDDISGRTIRRYMKNPENMRIKDLNRLGRMLGADIEQLRKTAIRY